MAGKCLAQHCDKIGLLALLGIVSLSLGILFSSLAKRESQAIQFLPVHTIPIFLLAGIFWPMEAIPTWRG